MLEVTNIPVGCLRICESSNQCSFSQKQVLGQRFGLRHRFQLWDSCVSVQVVGQGLKSSIGADSELYGWLEFGFVFFPCPHHCEAINDSATRLIAINVPFIFT